VGAESIFPLVIDDFLDSGIARHHFFLDFVVAEGQAFEEIDRLLQFLDHTLDGGRSTYSI
jgi:hypothetical protein